MSDRPAFRVRAYHTRKHIEDHYFDTLAEAEECVRLHGEVFIRCRILDVPPNKKK